MWQKTKIQRKRREVIRNKTLNKFPISESKSSVSFSIASLASHSIPWLFLAIQIVTYKNPRISGNNLFSSLVSSSSLKKPQFCKVSNNKTLISETFAARFLLNQDSTAPRVSMINLSILPVISPPFLFNFQVLKVLCLAYL